MRNPEYIARVQSGDGYRLVYRVWPAQHQRSGTIILVNGLMSHSVWFRHLACILQDYGLHVVGADRRGSGLNKASRGDAPSRQALVSDLLTIINAERRDDPVWLLGWCWGALPAINAALELGSELNGLILIAPGLFPSEQIKMAARMSIDASSDLDPAVPALPSPLTREMFSDRDDIRNFIDNDELAQRTFSFRFFSISREMSLIAITRLKQLAVPTLLVLAQQDETIDHEQTLRAFERLPLLTMKSIPGHHAIQLETPQMLATSMSEWMADQRARSLQTR